MELFPVCFKVKDRAGRIRENAECSKWGAADWIWLPTLAYSVERFSSSPFAGHLGLEVKARKKQKAETAQHIPFFLLKPFPAKNKEVEKTGGRRQHGHVN